MLASLPQGHYTIESIAKELTNSFEYYKTKAKLEIISSYLPNRRFVWENLDRGCEYRPNAVRSVHTTEVKILPYRPTKLG